MRKERLLKRLVIIRIWDVLQSVICYNVSGCLCFSIIKGTIKNEV
jgi:hypothetical protein